MDDDAGMEDETSEDEEDGDEVNADADAAMEATHGSSTALSSSPECAAIVERRLNRPWRRMMCMAESSSMYVGLRVSNACIVEFDASMRATSSTKGDEDDVEVGYAMCSFVRETDEAEAAGVVGVTGAC